MIELLPANVWTGVESIVVANNVPANNATIVFEFLNAATHNSKILTFTILACLQTQQNALSNKLTIR